MGRSSRKRIVLIVVLPAGLKNKARILTWLVLVVTLLAVTVITNGKVSPLVRVIGSNVALALKKLIVPTILVVKLAKLLPPVEFTRGTQMPALSGVAVQIRPLRLKGVPGTSPEVSQTKESESVMATLLVMGVTVPLTVKSRLINRPRLPCACRGVCWKLSIVLLVIRVLALGSTPPIVRAADIGIFSPVIAVTSLQADSSVLLQTFPLRIIPLWGGIAVVLQTNAKLPFPSGVIPLAGVKAVSTAAAVESEGR